MMMFIWYIYNDDDKKTQNNKGHIYTTATTTTTNKKILILLNFGIKFNSIDVWRYFFHSLTNTSQYYILKKKIKNKTNKMNRIFSFLFICGHVIWKKRKSKKNPEFMVNPQNNKQITEWNTKKEKPYKMNVICFREVKIKVMTAKWRESVCVCVSSFNL